MVIWAEYLTAIASAFGTTSAQAGVIFSLAFTMMSIISVLIATKGSDISTSVSFTALFMTLLFTFLGWYPVWTGSVLALVISILIASIFSGRGSPVGGKG